MAEPTTVLLVEDHASYRHALETLLEAAGDFVVVGRAGSAQEAVRAADEVAPRIAIVDLDLREGSGVDALAGIQAASPGTACVVLSGLRDDAAFGRAVAAGAAAALHKSLEVADLLRVLRAVAAGTYTLPALQSARWLRSWDSLRERRRRAEAVEGRLTRREREVLQALARGGSNVDIARALGIAPETVQSHIRNLLSKLAVHSRLEAVVTALRLGLVEPPR